MKKDRKRNNFYILFGLTAAVIIIAMTAMLFLVPEKTYSSREKRMLTTFPAFSLERLMNGRFAEDLEEFSKDQFYGRNLAADVKGTVQILIQNRESNGVYLLSDGRLAERFQMPGEEDFSEMMREIKQFSERHSEPRFYFLLSPTAVQIYEEELPPFSDAGGQDLYIDRVYEALQGNVSSVDVRNVFRTERERIELYYKTDHHWTTEGAKLAAAALLLKMGCKVDFTEESGIVCDSFVGSLAAKSGFPVRSADGISLYKIAPEPENGFYFTVTYVDEQKTAATCYNAASLQGDEPYEVFFGGNHAEIEIRTSLDTGRRLLIFKDSYANAAIPFLVGSFDEITVIDPRYYRGDIDLLTEEMDYTDIVFLYNANTLSEDSVLAMVLQNAQ